MPMTAKRTTTMSRKPRTTPKATWNQSPQVLTAADRLLQLEAEISAGLDQIEQGKQRVWQAVAEIRANDLWQLPVDQETKAPKYHSFLDYCKQQWGWEKSNAHENAIAGEVVSSLLLSGIPESELPTAVSQTRELSKVPALQRATVLQKAKAQNGGKLTAEAIKAVAATPAIGSELYYNGLPCHLTKVEGERAVVQFADGEYERLEWDRLTPHPPEPTQSAALRSCEQCQHCDSSGQSWYCLKYQQHYSSDENPAVHCGQFLRLSISLKPIQAVETSPQLPDLDKRFAEALSEALEPVEEWLGEKMLQVHRHAAQKAIGQLGALPVGLLAAYEADRDDLLRLREFIDVALELGI